MFLTFKKAYLPGWAEQNKRGAKALGFLIERPERFLITTLTGNNLVNVAYSSLLAILLSRYGVSEQVIFMAGPLILLVFGEIIPKSIARLIADQVALFVGQITYVLRLVFYPVTRLLEFSILWIRQRFNIPLADLGSFLDRTEIKATLKEVALTGASSSYTQPFILRLLSLEGKQVSSIMTPRTAVVGIEIGQSVQEAREIMVHSGHSRLLCYRERLDQPIGFVSVRNVLSRAIHLETVLNPIHSVPESISGLQLFSWFRKHNTGFAAVVDEFGGLAGVVSLEDLIEEMVGPIQDEFDPVHPGILQVSDSDWLIEGGTRLSQVEQVTGFEYQAKNATSMGGLVIELAEKIPVVGAVFQVPQGTLKVAKASKKVVLLVRMTLNQVERTE